MKGRHPNKARSRRLRMTDAASVARPRWWDGDFQSGNRTTKSTSEAFKFNRSILDRLDASPALLLTICLFGVLATTCFVCQSKAVQLRWQRSHQAAEAEKLIRRGEITPLNQDIFVNACKESPDTPHLLRALAISCATSDPALARRCYNRIAELHATTSQDEASHAVLLAKLADFNGARAILDHAQRGPKTDVSLEKAALVVARECGDFTEAARVLESLTQQKQSDLDEALETAEVAVHAGVEDDLIVRIERQVLSAFEAVGAQGRLQELGARVERLTCLPIKEPAIRARALSLFNGLKEPAVELRIALAIFAQGGVSGSREEFRRVCMSELHRNGGLSASEKERVAAMFQRRGEHGLVVDMITLPESLVERPLFTRRFDALLNLGQWRDAASMVTDVRAPKIVQSRTLCRTLAQLLVIPVSNPIAVNLLEESLKEAIAERSAPACYTIGCIAMEQHLGSLTEEAFANAISISKGKETMVENIMSTARRGGMAVSDLLNTWTRGCASLNPDAAMEKRICYLSLLSGQKSDAVQNLIHARIKSTPYDPYLRFLAALEHYSQGDFMNAAQYLMPLPQHAWHQGEAAVIASVMASAGQFDRSAGLIQKIDFSRLFQEEQALIEPWRTRLALGDDDTQRKLQASNP